MAAEGRFSFFVVRPLSDLFLWGWRIERRFEFLWRPRFDGWLRPPLFSFLQWLQNRFRRNEHLELAEEKPLVDEERYLQDIVDTLRKFTRENWEPGGAQRFGNTKTFGVLRGEFAVLPDLPEHLARGLFAQPADLPRVGAVLRAGAVRAARHRGPGPVLAWRSR